MSKVYWVGDKTVRNRVSIAIILVLVLGALTGCVSLPTSGPVNISKVKIANETTLGLYANGPTAGASPEDIVRGFLAAASSGYANDFAVAREFLTPQTAATWQPLASVTVYGNSVGIQLSRRENGAVEVNAQAVATLDKAGVYQPVRSPNATFSTEFSLIRNAQGQWRIAKLDNGVLIAHSIFQVLFKDKSLYFLTPDQQAIVADLRWYPRETLLSSLVVGILDGPVKWLAPGVYSALPAGAVLSSGTVTITNGVASFSLGSISTPLSKQEQNAIFQQLGHTLAEASVQVQQLDLSFGGNQIQRTVDSSNLSPYPYNDVGYLGFLQGSLVRITQDKKIVLSNDIGDAYACALGYGADPNWAIVDKGGVLVGGTDTDLKRVLDGGHILRPSWDRYNWLWTRSSIKDGVMVATDKNGAVRFVGADWLQGMEVSAFAVSREGARIVVARKNGNALELDVASVVRDVSGVPSSLSTPQVLPLTADKIISIAWVSPVTVAVINTSGSNTPVISLVTIGGNISTITPPEDAISITAGAGEGSIIVGTKQKAVYKRSGDTWRKVADNIIAPTLGG